MMELILNRSRRNHVSLDTVREFETTILLDSHVTAANKPNAILSGSSLALWKLLNKCNFPLPSRTGSLINDNRLNDRSLFSVVMAPNFSQCLPHFMASARKGIYVFDAWPSEHKVIGRFVKLFGVANVFVSSSQAASMLQAEVVTSGCYWIPEALNPEEYEYYPYERKDIDVLALGRRYDAYHERIVSHLENTLNTYLYEKTKGTLIFPGRRELIDGLARSKISICVPSSITHPTRCGGIETLTVRYLQSMISKCLVLGKAPQELTDLFGYNPVVDIDIDKPVEQLESILANFPNYMPLIEKNFNTVLKQHTWSHRWQRIKSILGTQ